MFSVINNNRSLFRRPITKEGVVCVQKNLLAADLFEFLNSYRFGDIQSTEALQGLQKEDLSPSMKFLQQAIEFSSKVLFDTAGIKTKELKAKRKLITTVVLPKAQELLQLCWREIQNPNDRIAKA